MGRTNGNKNDACPTAIPTVFCFCTFNSPLHQQFPVFVIFISVYAPIWEQKWFLGTKRASPFVINFFPVFFFSFLPCIFCFYIFYSPKYQQFSVFVIFISVHAPFWEQKWYLGTKMTSSFVNKFFRFFFRFLLCMRLIDWGQKAHLWAVVPDATARYHWWCKYFSLDVAN